jgi:hypothetical protein
MTIGAEPRLVPQSMKYLISRWDTHLNRQGDYTEIQYRYIPWVAYSVILVILKIFSQKLSYLSPASIITLTLKPWKYGQQVPPKHQYLSIRLHVTAFQKTVLFIFTAVESSNPTQTKQYLCNTGWLKKLYSNCHVVLQVSTVNFRSSFVEKKNQSLTSEIFSSNKSDFRRLDFRVWF